MWMGADGDTSAFLTQLGSNTGYECLYAIYTEVSPNRQTGRELVY